MEEGKARDREKYLLLPGHQAYSCARRVGVGKGEYTHALTMTCLCIYVHPPSFAGCLETRSWIMFASPPVPLRAAPLPVLPSAWWCTNPLRHSLPAIASLTRQRHPKVYRVLGSPLTLATLICYQTQISGAAVILRVFEKLDRLKNCKFFFEYTKYITNIIWKYLWHFDGKKLQLL